VKNQLPHKQEVDFDHDHLLGKFNFRVKKSPAGFMVTIRPTLTEPENETLEQETGSETQNLDSPASSPAPTPISSQHEIEIIADPAPTITESKPYQFENYAPPANVAPNESAVETTDTLSAEKQIEDAPVIENKSEETALNTEKFDTSSIESNAPIVETPTFETQPAKENIEDLIIREEPRFAETKTAVDQIQHHDFRPVTHDVVDHSPAQVIDPQSKAQMESLLKQMEAVGASDLHLAAGMPPMVRKDGKMQPLTANQEVLTPEMTNKLLSSITPKKNFDDFNSKHDTDFAYDIPGLARFRSNLFMDRKGMGGVFRVIPTEILTAEKLGLSPAIMNLCSLSKGLVVVTGPTGSGKSTTLCAMVDHINKNRDEHIITIEDPIEFVHENQKCLINQREVHSHTASFKSALRAALREDPDIVLVGEMRDLETIAIAIETAETGHLVFGTLHTTTAASTIDRIIDQFPADRQQQVRVMLSESLKGVVAQTLLPKKGGGRVAAMEVLIVTPAISNLIREGKTFQIPSSMQTGKAHGMVMLNDALIEHVINGNVEPRDAYLKAVDKPGFELLLEKNKLKL